MRSAKSVRVLLRRSGERAELTIADDGRGFDVVEAAKHSPGLGLVSITERIRLAGGSMSVVSEISKGTRIHVEVPTIPQPPKCRSGLEPRPAAPTESAPVVWCRVPLRSGCRHVP